MVAASTGKKPQVAPYSGAMLPMVALSATERWSRPGPKNSTNFPTTPSLRSICVTVSTRSVAVTPSFSCPLSLKPTTSGSSIDSGWPSIAASASMPPTPQPSTARPFTIVVCESVRTSDFEGAFLLANRHLLLAGPHRLREVFEIDLMADAGSGRHHGEIRERLLAPFQEFVALLILLVFLDHILAERLVVAEEVDDHAVIDDEIDRHQGIDL